MKIGKDNPLIRYKRMFIVYGVILVVVLLVFFITKRSFQLPGIVWVLAALAFLVMQVITFMALMKMLDIIDDTNTKLDKFSGDTEKLLLTAKQINQSSHLSEIAKAIAFRDSDMLTLRDVVFDKLQQKDFELAYELIDEIARRTDYRKLAEELRFQADEYRDASDTERMNQLISHIEKHIEEHQWVKAGASIEMLIKEYPTNDKALSMMQHLSDKKDERKKVLLNAWDDAVKRQATDRSLEILRELDLYLTPNEALALQEAARDVFRTKLHNLGVQFSLAVSGKQWTKALETGREIIRDFPNSRMAEEIREKFDALQIKAQQ